MGPPTATPAWGRADGGRLQALIWDVDGTLADTELDGHLPAFNQAFAEAGLNWHWDRATYLDLLAVTGGKERILAWWQRVDPAGAAGPGTAGRIRALHVRKTALYTARVAEGRVALRPGVARLIAAARASGLRQAIATTTTPENVHALLAATLGPEAPTWFEVIGAGDVVPAKKPAPDIYHWVLARLGLPATACVAIEDSAAGAAAALAAGLPTLVVRCAGGRNDPMPDAHAAGWTGRLIGEAAVIPTLANLRTCWPARRAPSARGALFDAARSGERLAARPEPRPAPGP